MEPKWEYFDLSSEFGMTHAQSYMTVRSVSLETSGISETWLPIPKFSEHLTSPTVIKLYNERVNGMITQWKLGVKSILLHHKHVGVNQEGPAEEQADFGEYIVPPLQEGIDAFNMFPVGIMNVIALQDSVMGIDSDDAADFVYHMANCQTFKLIVKPFGFLKAFEVWTLFEGRTGINCIRAYGKHKYKVRVDDDQIDMLLRQDRKKRSTMKMAEFQNKTKKAMEQQNNK